MFAGFGLVAASCLVEADRYSVAAVTFAKFGSVFSVSCGLRCWADVGSFGSQEMMSFWYTSGDTSRLSNKEGSSE